MWLSHDFGYEIMRRDFIFAVKQFSELLYKKFDIVMITFMMIWLYHMYFEIVTYRQTGSIVQQSHTSAICYQKLKSVVQELTTTDFSQDVYRSNYGRISFQWR